MTTQQSPTPIHEAVREHYAERIRNNASCCGPSDCCSTESNLYPADLLGTLPEGESTVSYGCGDPITLASLQPGQTVLDLGSGAGLDCFFAAKKVGETGRVTCQNVRANTVIVAGAVRGNITTQKMEIRSSGRVWGDVVTTAFVTEEGAFLRGQIRMEETVELDLEAAPETTPSEAVQAESIAQTPIVVPEAFSEGTTRKIPGKRRE